MHRTAIELRYHTNTLSYDLVTRIRTFSYLEELLVFSIKEARACVFAGSFFVLLFLSSHIPLWGLARYDFLFLAALGLQLLLC